MKKKWIVMVCVSVLTVGGVWPGLQRCWRERAPQADVPVDRALRRETIDMLVAKLNDHYVFPETAGKIASVLRQRRREGAYEGITDGYVLARRLTTDLRGVSRDVHLTVRFAPGVVLPEEAGGPAPASRLEWEQRNNAVTRFFMRHTATRGKVRVGRLGANIGYLWVSGFPDAFLMTEKYAAAMNKLADTDGLIMDLRHNVGGDPQAVVLLASYFVDARTRLNDIWDRETGAATEHWTEDRLDGKRYGGKKPVFILVGPDTMSAGEDFAYTMQSLKRATLIGARTWGGAHPASPHRIGPHFIAVIPGQRSISPITGSNWEAVGVEPDIDVEPDVALATAETLMRRRLRAAGRLAGAAP